MEWIVLGSGGGWAGPGGAAAGYLLRHQGFDLWVDAGTGTMANLQEHVALTDVDAVVVSHRHFDHFLDLYPFFLAVRYGGGEPPAPIPLFGPPGMFQHALQLEENLPDLFAPTVVEPGRDFEAGPFVVRTAPMRHPVPTLGMRFETDGRVLAYSADTGPTEELVRIGREADVMVAEATWLDPRPGVEPAHMTAAEAGESAARAGVGRLILTHVWPTLDREEVVRQAAETFRGPVAAAREGLRVEP